MTAEAALVTGAFGAIGRHVARRLADDGYLVTGIGHGDWSPEEARTWGLEKFVCSDVTLASLVQLGLRPVVVIHCAGSGSVAASVAMPYRDFLCNVESVAAVLEYVRTVASRARFVFASSAAVYGRVERQPIREDSPRSPASPYGIHKVMAEDMVQGYAKIFGISSAIIRLFSVYGEGFRKQLLWDACNRISAGDLGFFGTGNETRDWLHVSDAAALLVEASRRASPECPIANGGSGNAISNRELLAYLFSLFGCDRAPVFCGTERAGDPTHYCADTTVTQGWGWTPAIEWRQGVDAYAHWFRQQLSPADGATHHVKSRG